MSTELAFCVLFAVLQQSPAGLHKSQPHHPHGHAFKTHAPHRVDCRFPVAIPSCGPFVSGFFFDGLLSHSYHCSAVSTVEFFGPAFGFGPIVSAPFDPFAFGGIGPVFVWPEPIFQGPVFVGPAPAPAPGPRLLPRFVQPAVAPGGTTDIPERVIDDLIGKRRPNLAQRAQAARLEGAGDRMFQAGHFARAAERFQQALGHTPDNDEAKFKRGAALAGAGQYHEAGRVLRDALRDRPDWPFVPHDLRALFPNDAAVAEVLEKLDRESGRPDADNEAAFLSAYVLYFTGQRAAAAAIFRNPPAGGSTTHYDVFRDALERQREHR